MALQMRPWNETPPLARIVRVLFYFGAIGFMVEILGQAYLKGCARQQPSHPQAQFQYPFQYQFQTRYLTAEQARSQTYILLIGMLLSPIMVVGAISTIVIEDTADRRNRKGVAAPK